MIDTRVKDGLRAGVAAVGVATGLMVLASTSQTPDGFIHASFGGPMDVFSPAGASDVLAIGDGGIGDASELAALLKGPTSPAVAAPDSPIRAAFEAGAMPSSTNPSPTLGMVPFVGPTAIPTLKDATILPVKPVVDAQGKIDCTGSVSCRTDPTTNITTVTYPDGIVAIVQKINDLTVVAYKTLTDVLPDEVKSLLPAVPDPAPVVLGAPANPGSMPTSVAPSLPTAATVPSVTPDLTPPSFDPGPLAPDTDISGPTTSRTGSGPRVNVVRPPMDFSPDTSPGGTTGTGGQKPNLPVLGKVKDALGSAVDAVSDVVGKALNPGASGKPSGSGEGRPSTP